MISFFRKHTKKISFSLLLCFVTEWSGNLVYALTSGPSQPETQQFAPAGMDNMVDPFTGDFSYNIPLLDVGGYPVNLNYAAGITPDAEASWVGLGWNLNVGAINRSVRGLPDDFAGDQVIKDYNVKPNETYGATSTVGIGIYGFQLESVGVSLSASGNYFYNTYNGFGMSQGVGASVSAGAQGKGGMNGSLGLALNVGSETGLEVTPTIGISAKQTKGDRENTLGASLSFPFSTREGLKGMTLSASLSSSKGTTKEEHKQNSRSGSNSAFMGFASPTYTPSMEHDLYNVNISTGASFGFTNPATEFSFGFSGYYAGQFLNDTRKVTPAYGYMYSGLSSSSSKLLDFNREKDANYNQFTANLPLTNYTYDVFQVSGQGIGGAYRLYRGDVGSVHDPLATSTGSSPGVVLNLGFGVTPSTIVSSDVDFNYSESSSGKWTDDRGAINNFQNENSTALNNVAGEMAYFKKIGEFAPEQDNYFLNQVQNKYGAVRHDLSQSTDAFGDGLPNGNYAVWQKDKNTRAIVKSNPRIPVNANKRIKRSIRNTAFTTLNALEASKSAILPIESYNKNDFNWQYKSEATTSVSSTNANKGYAKKEIKRLENGRKPHHISETRVTDENGSRYIYGIPAYNTLQEEVTFALNGGNPNTGLTSYTPGVDDSKGNTNGLDYYYNKVTTPAFAHSYLLTCILSADYVDRDGIPGPSDGDLGSYTKFNYTRAIEKYKWRTPFSETLGVASFTEGMQGTHDDDKGNYIYGEKEVWYLHSIETRTHVAEFYLKDRLDGKGTLTKHGGIGTDPLQRLDKIVLYSKSDKGNSKAEPIKVVHFDYDYSLCPNTPNSTFDSENPNRGKLTLKKVWFTYGNSEKGVLNPYLFEYAQGITGQYDTNLNPSYDFKNYDRWGNYKPDLLHNIRNAEFPYANSKKSESDFHAGAYALSSIKTPTGGTMRVFYESDDYAYVQNKRAMRMFHVVAASAVASDAGANSSLYNGSPDDKQYLIVDLAEGFTPKSEGNKNSEFQKDYLSGIDLMYYKFLLKVIGSGPAVRSEYVPGYAEINISESVLLNTNVTQEGGKNVYHRAAIKLKTVKAKTGKSSSRDVNPIVRNGWMYARLNLSRELMGSFNANDGALTQIVQAVLAQSQTIYQLFSGFVNKMLKDGNSKDFTPSSSFVRLNEPDKIKQGGGHRVKALIMADNWGLMRSAKESNQSLPNKQTSYYGQAYDYTFMENGRKISAGVSAYEPILGGEENPFRRPVFVREKVPLAPEKEYYLEEPFGESFFPAPTVGYRKVSVIPVKITGDITNTNFVGNGTGRVEHEFYTAYDFPSITFRTDLQTYRHKPNILFKFMKFDCDDKVTCSQGYYIELNDMHGKQKAQRVYPDANESAWGGALAFDAVKPISEVEYRYKVNKDGTLNNNVTYVNSDLGIVKEEDGPELGSDVDMVQDERYSESSTEGGGAHINVKWVQYLFVPTIVPMVFPQLNHESTRFRSLVTTKVVNKYGILESTTAKDNGASITTKNLAWDGITGKVLLTQVQNEFHDPIYNFTYPAYWAYERFQLASKNEGLVFTANKFNALKAENVLKDGDEVCLLGNPNRRVFLNEGNLIDAQGVAVGSYSKAKVIRSGARNTANVPVGTVTTLQNPIQDNSSQLVFGKVLNAGASEFSEDWKRFCNCSDFENSSTKGSNPYILGLKGNPRPMRSWTYLTDRTQSQINNELNIRADGFFKDYTSYWTFSNGKLVSPADVASSKWQFVTEILNYNSTGMEIENKDALGRASMAQFGYARNLPVATSNNSKYQETGYDGFEDYDFGDCEDDHLSWRAFSSNITKEQAHTGRKSIRVGPAEGVKIKKVIVACEDPVNAE